MAHENGSEDDLKAIVKRLQHEVQAKDNENQHLQTRLKGYETVAKLSNDEVKENKKLKQQIEALQTGAPDELKPLTVHNLERKSSEKEVHDAIPYHGLTDFEKVPSAMSSPRGSSSSFTIIGRSSRSSPVTHNHLPSGPTNGQREVNSCSEMNSSNGNAALGENEPNPNNGSVSPGSTSVFKDKQKESKYEVVDEYIQVFPAGSQSGGSNFYEPSLDSRVLGGPSCTNSSRRGPMSIIAVNNGSIPSYHYVEMKEKDEIQELVESENHTSEVRHLANASSTSHDIFSGTGARPKVLYGEFGKWGEGSKQIFSPAKGEDSTTNKLVKIPTENSESYRINNAPMLSYGKQESQTEISALTSFGSSITSFSPDKAKQEHGYNNLDMIGQNSQATMKASTSSICVPNVSSNEDFVMIGEVPPIFPVTSSIKPISEDLNNSKAQLVKELEVLQKRTKQLHLANKEWKDSWDALKKQKEDENVQLQAQVKELTREKDQIRQEKDYSIASLEEELKKKNQLNKDINKQYLELLKGRAQEKQLLDKLKKDYGTIHQENRTLEIKMEDLQANKSVVDPRALMVSDNNFELQTELSMVKRQMTLFMEDFEKEHQERIALETKLQREREKSQHLDAKLKKAHALLTARDEGIRQKSKQVADLQFQVDDLKLKLEVELRKSSIYPSMDLTSQCSVQATDRPRNANATVTTQNLNVHAQKPHRWSCRACTFANEASQKKCEICGTEYTCSEKRYLELH